jgi:TolA-binding protein
MKLKSKARFQVILGTAILLLALPLFSNLPLHAVDGVEEADFLVIKKTFNSGLYSAAQEKIETFLRDYPRTTRIYDVHLLLARSLYHQNNLTRAMYEFDIILDAPGGNKFEDEALYWTGEIYLKNGDFKKALELYQKIIDVYASSRYLSYALYAKAYAYYELGSLEDAIISFREVVSKYPFDKVAMESQFRIGQCEYILGRYESAAKELSAFIEKYPVSEKAEVEKHFTSLIDEIF